MGAARGRQAGVALAAEARRKLLKHNLDVSPGGAHACVNDRPGVRTSATRHSGGRGGQLHGERKLRRRDRYACGYGARLRTAVGIVLGAAYRIVVGVRRLSRLVPERAGAQGADG